MELYREVSTTDKEHIIYKYLALAVIFLSFAYEIHSSFILHRTSLFGWGYSFLFLALWLWRTGFTYTYILREEELEIVREGFGLTKSFAVPLATVESFTNCYVRSFFRRTKISKYTHSYSSVDPRMQRLVVYRQGKTLQAVILKVSASFLTKLQSVLPDKFLDFKS